MRKRAKLYVSVLEGDGPEEMRPILMTRDPAILRAVADALIGRLGCLTPLQSIRPGHDAHRIGEPIHSPDCVSEEVPPARIRGARD